MSRRTQRQRRAFTRRQLQGLVAIADVPEGTAASVRLHPPSASGVWLQCGMSRRAQRHRCAFTRSQLQGLVAMGMSRRAQLATVRLHLQSASGCLLQCGCPGGHSGNGAPSPAVSFRVCVAVRCPGGHSGNGAPSPAVSFRVGCNGMSRRANRHRCAFTCSQLQGLCCSWDVPEDKAASARLHREPKLSVSSSKV